MCGRFVFLNTHRLAEQFGPLLHTFTETRPDLMKMARELGGLDLGRPRFNIAPTQQILTIVNHGSGREVEIMRWGFIPSWAKADNLPRNTFMARDDRLLESGMWRGSLRHKRCVIPSDGYYEWQRSGGSSRPYFVHPKDGRIWGFAGLYDVWNSPDGSSIASCAIITTSANERLSEIHDRMPAILDGQAEEMWLDPSVDDRQALQSIVRPLAPDLTEFYPVSTLVNSVANDSADNIARAGTLL